MKKILLFSIISAGILFLGCSTKDTVAPYTPPVTINFTVASMNHTKDTVKAGDTIYLNVAGTMFDTLNVYTYLTAKSSASGSPVYTYGTATSPIKINRVLGSSNASDMNPWTSTIAWPGITSISGSKLTITANFVYQLSLSSEGGGLAAATDAGLTNKTVYIK